MKKILIATVLIILIVALSYYLASQPSPVQQSAEVTTEITCPTPETIVNDFNTWSIEFLDGNPTYAEKEQREGWQKHLEEMGCIESQDIIDNAICADCDATGL